jgi:predicted TIM-barrel fold metal-dependent hydrolase
MPPLIALEEHYFADTDVLPRDLVKLYAEQFKHIPSLDDKLKSLDTLRIEEMKKAGVTLQIISHAPGLSSSAPADCTKVNDYLASKISSRKNIFRGLAVLPMGDPEEAAMELGRTVKEHGFVGALIDNHVTTPLKTHYGSKENISSNLGATYYDSPHFHPVWKAAEKLNVPVYIHPMFPTPAMRSHYNGVPSDAGASIATSGWGWHSDCGTHILRMYASGIFDAFPRLRIIIGHFGEMLPYMLDRVNQLSNRWGKQNRCFQTVYDENIFITTSGVWSVAPMATIARSTRTDNILFSIDWPFAHSDWGKAFWTELQESKIFSGPDLENIGWRNAAKLFGLDNGELIKDAQSFQS